MLVGHVLIGIVGLIASYAVLMGLLKKKLPLTFLRVSAIIAFLSYLSSWGMGGYYYVLRYGSEVKPIIKSGDYPWAHALFMEGKEHIFLFIPVLTFIIMILLWFLGDRIATEKRFRRPIILLALLTTTLAIFITAAGIVISGAAQ